MGLVSRSLLLFLGSFGICSGFVQENCSNYELQFERVYSIPGDVAMLSSSLVSPEIFNFTSVPYNITWYKRTGQEISNQTGRILVQGDTLWFLNVTLEDDGEYVTILRTPYQCYMQATMLVVDLPVPGECGKPRKAAQTLTYGVTDKLSCPLWDPISKLKMYNIPTSIKWYRDCEPIEDGHGQYTYWDTFKLNINEVGAQNQGFYTCTMTFTLGGVTGSMSETIDAWVKKEYSLVPQVHEPANEIIKARIGSEFSKKCLVFVPCVGPSQVDVMWLVKEDFIHDTNRVSISERSWRQDVPVKGVWIEQLLTISELMEEDFNISFTCRAYSYRGSPERYFTLLPEDPNIILPSGLVLGAMAILFINSVIIYSVFKVDIVLWFRRAFPVLYPNKDLDGKLYDAYVAYPQPCAAGFSDEVEVFALNTLPQVLEKSCGYRLFIAGRDCLPGMAIVDSVEENLQASRRVLLLYTASTFISKTHTSGAGHHNNNNLKSDASETSEIETTENNNSISNEEVYTDTKQQLECVSAMHRALIEGSLKVILVELEEISPAQLALFPESVRQLRNKQGAVCWWKNMRKTQSRTCMRRSWDEEKGGQDTKLTPSLSPSSKFWKEVRYNMPVRGKSAVFPKKTALLNSWKSLFLCDCYFFSSQKDNSVVN